jgi:hypothetical protein
VAVLVLIASRSSPSSAIDEGSAAIDENLNDTIFRLAERAAAERQALLVPHGPDLDALLAESGRDEPVPHGVGTLLGESQGRGAVTPIIGTADDSDGQIGAGLEPLGLAFDDPAGAPPDCRTVLGEEHAITDVDKERPAILGQAFGLIDTDGALPRLIPFLPERRQSVTRTSSLRRTRVVGNELLEQPAGGVEGMVGSRIHAIDQEFRGPSTFGIGVLRTSTTKAERPKRYRPHQNTKRNSRGARSEHEAEGAANQ